MAFVVTEKCILCKLTDCVESCPMECFREGPNFVVIDPDECIDCGACATECPLNAIYSEDELPEKYQAFKELNAELAKKWPGINKKKDPLQDADKWAKVEDKLQYLIKESSE